MSTDPLDLSGGANDNRVPPGSEPKKDVGRLGRLQQKLYSPNTQFQIRGRKRLRNKDYELQDDWDDTKPADYSQTIKAKKISIFAKIAAVAFVFFVASLSYAYFMFMSGDQTVATNDVEITIIGPVAIGGGEELSLDIIVENNSNIQLNTVDIVLEFPEGTKSSTNLQAELPRIRDGVGNLAPQSVIRENYRAALFGQEGTSKEIIARIEYSVPGSNAIYTREKTFTLALQSSPIRIAIDTVKEITSNQELVFDVAIASNSNESLKNVLVKVDYPFGFVFSSADIAPTYRNNTWLFSSLEPLEEKTFKVRGVLDGQDNEERVFTWDAGVASEENQEELAVTFISFQKPVTIIKPFLALDISIDGQRENDLVKLGAKEIEGRISFLNNTGSVIKDAEITLQLNGEVIADNRVEVGQGFYNSTDNRITWNKTTSELFEEVPPGYEETLIFNFMTKPLATRNAVYKNPEIVIDASVSGNRISEAGVSEGVDNVSVKRIKILTDVNIEATSNFAGGPFQNTGPIPPVVEEPTTYTVNYVLSNSSNMIQNGKLVAVLPEYMRWNNQVSPASETVLFDEVNRTLTWDLGDIREHVGYIDPARAVSFQVTLVPSASQLGETPDLIKDPKFEGFDTFTNTTVESEPEETPDTDLGFGGLEDSRVVDSLR